MSQGKRYKFFGTQFQVSSSFGTAHAITGITNANPAVVTQAGHGYTAPTVVRMAAVVGMTELNGNLYVIDPIDADTYSLVGVDSLNYGTYASGGTAAPAVWSGSCESTQYSDSSGSTPVSEDETNCGVGVTFGAPRMGTVSLNFNQADTAYQNALEASRLAASDVALKLTKPNYPAIAFDIGTVTGMDSSGSAGGTWTGTATLQRTQHRASVAV